MRVFDTIDDLKGAVGEELGVSDWFTIDQDRINQFADATEDHQWIHVDVDRPSANCRPRTPSRTVFSPYR